jgi:NAD(P)-dependent dehydrogenase (short-subunit alcohol dehydrogenase family)
MELKDKVAVITGGATGIGRSIGKSLAKAGMHVAIADIDDLSGKKTSDELKSLGVKSMFHHTDVTSITSLENLAEKVEKELGDIFLVCNNAGVIFWETMHEVSQEDWDFLFSVNVNGVMNGIRVFLPRLLQSKQGGRILNTASLGGHAPFQGMGPYIPSKFCVVGISEVLRMDLADTNVGVSVLCPGNVKSAIAEKTLKWAKKRNKDKEKIEMAEQAVKMLDEIGMDTNIVGELVRRALEADEFYIFTSIGNPPSRETIEIRTKEIFKALDTLEERLKDIQNENTK